ncbi:MAG TPA: LysR substrate-binding domain-containing protein [Myxococcaceae bacterium]|nr:LysR substrate-binding domain-containing protein [Myxococcaceae bacterium]
METLDLELIRTLAAVQELGTLARASRRVGRTLSAVSLQLKRLESQCGRPLFHKVGRNLQLNPDGEWVLAVGRRMLALNDQLLQVLREDAGGMIRLGVPQDVAERWLPTALARFTRAHPHVQLEVRVERNLVLQDLLARADLDLAIVFDADQGRPDPDDTQLPVRWLAAPGFRWDPGTPLPLVLFQQPCTFRRLGIEALDRAGIPWRVAFTSPSLSGLWAAASAGLGVTVRTELGLPPRVVRLQDRRLPPLPSMAFRVVGVAEAGPGRVGELRAALVEMLREAADRSGVRSRQHAPGGRPRSGAGTPRRQAQPRAAR